MAFLRLRDKTTDGFLDEQPRSVQLWSLSKRSSSTSKLEEVKYFGRKGLTWDSSQKGVACSTRGENLYQSPRCAKMKSSMLRLPEKRSLSEVKTPQPVKIRQYEGWSKTMCRR